VDDTLGSAKHAVTDPRPPPSVHGRGTVERLSAWMGGAIEALGAMRPALAVELIAGVIGVGWGWVYLAGGAHHAPPHWFYLPILLAAARFGLAGALVAAAVSGVVAGPLLPADVATGTAQLPSDMAIRAISFLVIGGLIGSIVWRLERSLAREADIARREAELSAHKAAVISTVSHEFRTPLAVLLGSTRLLLQEQDQDWPEPARSLLEGIGSSTRRLSDLVTTVLAVSEGPVAAEDPVFSRVPLADVVTAVVTGTDPRDTARLEVEVGEALVRTAPAALETLLRQLVDNALRFSPPEEPVTITAPAGGGDHLQIVIGDRGPGIDAEFLPKAFEPFTQHDDSSTRAAGGLGIGLFVAHRLAEHLGAVLELRPRSGGGTEAVLTFGPRGTPVEDAEPFGSVRASPSSVR
jgi:signal transduction histidine kinase